MDNLTNGGTQGPAAQITDLSDFDFSIPGFPFPPQQTAQGNPNPGPVALPSTNPTAPNPGPATAPAVSHAIAPTPEPDRLTGVLTGRLRQPATRTLPIRRGPEARGLQPLYDNMTPEELERRRRHNVAQAHENKRQQRERNNAAAKRSRERRVHLIEDQAREIQRLREDNGALSRERDYWKSQVEALTAAVTTLAATAPAPAPVQGFGLGLPPSVGGTPGSLAGFGQYNGLPVATMLGGGTSVDVGTTMPTQPGQAAAGGIGGTNYIGQSSGFSANAAGTSSHVGPFSGFGGPGADGTNNIGSGPSAVALGAGGGLDAGASAPGAVLPNAALANPQNASMVFDIDEFLGLDPNADYPSFPTDMGSI